MKKEKNNELFVVVKKMIFEKWDPIGISLALEPSRTQGCDQYDNYIPKLISILEKDSNAIPLLIKYFATIRGYFGLDTDVDYDSKVAHELKQVYDQYFSELEK